MKIKIISLQSAKTNILANCIILLIFCIGIPCYTFPQQVSDTGFTFRIHQAAYQQGQGPVIFIDEAHSNLHTKDGGFYAFAKLMEQDGYRVKGLDKQISALDILYNCKILLIANALHPLNETNWVLPTPSAFSQQEIEILVKWVEAGGSLFLIADHMPFAGAADELAKAFGFEFLNGFAITASGTWPPSVFLKENHTLNDSPIIQGVNVYEKIDKVATFTGSAFRAPDGAIPVLSFLDKHNSLQPDTAWRFHSKTPSQKLGGYCQGAIIKFGKGRIAVFGEAAMFTAQIVNGNFKVGFNSEDAPQNAQFTINLIHWLDCIEKKSDLVLVKETINHVFSWASEKDFKLFYNSIANDSCFISVTPNDRVKFGFEAVMADTSFWGDERFKAIGYEINDLRINFSTDGNVAWFYCKLNDWNEWNGQAANWENVRWTGVLEKMDGQWRIRQQHFSYAK